jgi:hypothetical protein
MSIKTIQASEGWVKLVTDVSDKSAKTVQCRGEDPLEVAVFKDSVTPGLGDAGLILYPKRFLSKDYVQSEQDSVRAAPSGDESIYARAYLNKPAVVGVMV